jgi:hypothetical protein
MAKKVPFELGKPVDTLSLFVGAVMFTISKSPQSVAAVCKHPMENFWCDQLGLNLTKGYARWLYGEFKQEINVLWTAA